MVWDVRGKTALITGATSGIGREASIQLARGGARVIMIGRDRARTESALADIVVRTGSKEVSCLICDFSSQAAIRELAVAVQKNHDRLHILVNNAGGVNRARRLTADGVEATFAVNHLGPFLLTNLLRDLLEHSAPGRVITVASIGHRQGSIDFNDLGFERGYSIMRAYARSKLANVLFAAELALRLEGRGVTSNSIHPGSVNTNIWSGAPPWAKPLITILFRPFFISAERGAAHVVALATRPDLDGVTGKYFEKEKMVEPARLARDMALARRLWDVSASLVHLPAST